jgi:hypothetical protein
MSKRFHEWSGNNDGHRIYYIQWTGDNVKELAEFTEGKFSYDKEHDELEILAVNNEGSTAPAIGDYLLKRREDVYHMPKEVFDLIKDK